MAREKMPFVVFGFDSTHAALDAEEALERDGVVVVPIPAPASLSAICGIALRVALSQREQAARVLEAAGIRTSGCDEIEDV